MINFCCCASSRKPSSAKGKEPELPAPPPPVRLPGTHTLAPPVPPFAQPTYSAASVSSTHGLPGPSSLVPAPYPYLDPGDLVVDDSEDEAELQPASQTNGGSTTSLVQRIRKQFSTDALPRKKEPAPIAYTPEELAWRAQLKRSRNERIRQEVSLGNNTSRTYPSEGPSKPRLEPNPSIDLPGGGPRDCLEFTLEDDSRGRSRSYNSLYNECEPSGERRSSCPECESPTQIAGGKRLLQERSSLPQMPQTPAVSPRHFQLASSSSTIDSLRLSYSPGQLDELRSKLDQDISHDPSPTHALPTATHVRASASRSPRLPFSNSLSRSTTPPSHPGASSNDNATGLGRSPQLSTWLRSQGYRSRSPSVSNIPTSDTANDPAIQKAEAVFIRRCSSVQNVETHTIAEADLPRPEIVHLHQMDIHRRLTTHVINGREGSSAPSEPGNATIRAQAGNEASTAERDDQNPQDDMEDPSSIYTCADDSQDPSPEDSSFHLPQPHASWKNSLALLGPGSIYPGNPFRRDSYPPIDEGSPASPDSGVQTSRRSATPEPTTTSLLNDMNPQVVERHIHPFLLGHGAPPAISQRFSRQAGENSPDSPKSLLTRLHLPSPKKAKLNPRSFDGSDSADQQGSDSLRLNLPKRDGSAGLAGRVVTRDSAGSERRSCSPRQQVVKKDSQSSLPGRLGSTIWSGLSKLIPSRVPPGSTSAKASEGKLEHPEPRLPAEGGQFELDALRREVHSLKHEIHRLQEVAYPAPMHQSGGFGTLRTTARADGSGHSSSAAGWHTPTEFNPITPGFAGRRGQSSSNNTGTTDRFLTPFTNLSVGNGHENTSSSSFHSMTQNPGMVTASRDVQVHPLSTAATGRNHHLSEYCSTDSLASVKSESDLAVERNIRRQFAKMGGNLTRAYLEEEEDDGPSASASGTTQSNMWNGRSSPSPAVTAVHTNTPVGDEGVSGPSSSGSDLNQATRRRLWQGRSDSPPLSTRSYGSDSMISAKLPAIYSTRRRP